MLHVDNNIRKRIIFYFACVHGSDFAVLSPLSLRSMKLSFWTLLMISLKLFVLVGVLRMLLLSMWQRMGLEFDVSRATNCTCSDVLCHSAAGL